MHSVDISDQIIIIDRSIYTVHTNPRKWLASPGEVFIYFSHGGGGSNFLTRIPSPTEYIIYDLSSVSANNIQTCFVW
jgi:hypothetical protein